MDHLSSLRAVDHEVRGDQLIIKFSNGAKLIESEAQQLNMSIAEQLTQGQMVRGAMRAIELVKGPSLDPDEFDPDKMPNRCGHTDSSSPEEVDPQCFKEEGHEGPHMHAPYDEPPPPA